MRRAIWIVLSLAACLGWSGCVSLPDDPEAMAPADAALGDLELDGGGQRPPVGEPYRGLQCATSEPARDGGGGGDLIGELPDAAAMFAGSGGNGGGGGEPSGPPPMGMDASVPALPGPKHAGDVVITEVMFDPAGRSDTDGEWIELWNALDAEPLSLESCVLDDGGATPRTLSAFVIEPLAYATIGRGQGAGFLPDVVAPITLTNTADTVALLCDGVEIDRVRYDKSFPLRPGASLALDPALQTATDNDTPASWCRGVDDYGGDLGTPGAANPSCTPSDAGAP